MSKKRTTVSAGSVDKIHTIRLILGDQLNLDHSWLQKVDPEVLYILMEVRSETDYVMHHIQKVIAFFIAMRRFADVLRERGHAVQYLALDDPDNAQSFTKNLAAVVTATGAHRVEYQLPDEYRVDQELKSLGASLGVEVASVDTEHFFSQRDELAQFFADKKSFLMESFYRSMRKKHDLLMEGGAPEGGTWNFDADNRKPLPQGLIPPPSKRFSHDATPIMKLLTSMRVKTFGELRSGRSPWPADQEEAREVLEYFCRNLLPSFGSYEDAMSTAHRDLFHSRLSFAMNVKLISPREVCERAIAEYRRRPEEISLPQIEGFVRQILGWREYMRGIYWAKMPGYEQLNFFEHAAPLPDYFWSGDTKMACVREVVRASLEEAYAHHIQRLMVTGNFALLAGIHPDQIDQWYLGIYIDALQWVEITNTRGMSQYADGGIVGTKPYVSSANYIKKMSNYCRGCHYSSEQRHGEGACPFNALYWEFYDRHRAKLERNPRIGMAYRTLDKMDTAERERTIAWGRKLRGRLEEL